MKIKKELMYFIVMLLLLLSVLTGCLRKPEIVVLPESNTIVLKQGQAAPFDGWLLTDAAVIILLEEAERCLLKND